MNEKFQHQTGTLSPELINHIGTKYESKDRLKLPITEDELREECAGYTECENALNQMFDYSIQYANDVWSMKKLLEEKKDYDLEEWAALYDKSDSDRTRLHNTLIDSIAILIRRMNNEGLEVNWAKELMPLGHLERVYCGKFAIMLAYSRYVNSQE